MTVHCTVEPDREETFALEEHAWPGAANNHPGMRSGPSSVLQSGALGSAHTGVHCASFHSSEAEEPREAFRKEALVEHGESVLAGPSIQDRRDRPVGCEAWSMQGWLTVMHAYGGPRNDEVLPGKDEPEVDHDTQAERPAHGGCFEVPAASAEGVDVKAPD